MTDTEQRLRWLQEAARVMSTGHALTADELLSDMVASLGERGLAPIANKGNAYQLARWRMADWLRTWRAITSELDEAQTAAPEVDEVAPDEPTDLGDLGVWRRLFERQLARELGRPVHLSDRRVKELLRARAKRMKRVAPDMGLELLAIASEPSTVVARRGRRAS